MDIRNIKTFVRVAELKSFTKAADEMNYVQSTATMQIRQLEKELGYPLFDRIGKKVSLTALGAEFLSYAYEILHVMEKAELLGKDVADISGSLRIGVSESLMFGVLVELLPEFKNAYKNLEIRIKTGHTPELIDELKKNQLDLVYISADPNTDPDLHCYYIRRENLVFLCGTNHPAAAEKRLSPSELMKYEFLVTEKEGYCHRQLQKLAMQYKVTLLDSVELDSVYVITELAQKGLGLAFLPEFAVARQLRDGALIKLDVDLPPQIYHSQILSHKNRWISPFMEEFIHRIMTLRPAEE